jgi:hypothetical protein
VGGAEKGYKKLIARVRKVWRLGIEGRPIAGRHPGSCVGNGLELSAMVVRKWLGRLGVRRKFISPGSAGQPVGARFSASFTDT